MKQNQNSRRINQMAREKLGYILLFEVSDPDLELITLTGVEVSIDKSFCRAYISCDRDRYESVSAALERAKGRIRSLLGRSLGWRVTPELSFSIDTTTDEAESIAFCRSFNDRTAEAVRAHPHRFAFAATLPLPCVDAACAEAERADIGVVQGVFYTRVVQYVVDGGPYHFTVQSKVVQFVGDGLVDVALYVGSHLVQFVFLIVA